MKLAECGLAVTIDHTEETLEEVVRNTLRAVDSAYHLGFGRTAIVIRDLHDTMFLSSRLAREFMEIGRTDVVIFFGLPINSNNLLSDAAMQFAAEKLRSIFVVSSSLASMIDAPNVARVLNTFCEPRMPHENCATVSGLVLEPLQKEIYEGQMSNLFAVWDLSALAQAHFFGPPGPTEEIRALIRIVLKRGKCLAPVVPASQDAGGYKKLAGLFARGNEVQLERCIAAKQAGSLITRIASGVIPSYRLAPLPSGRHIPERKPEWLGRFIPR